MIRYEIKAAYSNEPSIERICACAYAVEYYEDGTSAKLIVSSTHAFTDEGGTKDHAVEDVIRDIISTPRLKDIPHTIDRVGMVPKATLKNFRF